VSYETFAYNTKGNNTQHGIKSYSSSNILATTYEDDSYGRQTAIVDPSAGRETFTYDSAGNLLTQTDANGKTNTMGYDSYNRLISKACPEFTTRYRYNADNQLAADSINSNLFKSYTYDTYGRLLMAKETVAANKYLQKSQGYNSNGQVSYVSYTTAGGAATTENYSYANGYLTEIKLSGVKSIWKLNSENAFGQPTEIEHGPVTRNYTYNTYGFPTGEKAKSTASGTFFDYTYSFDSSKGNLTYRKDNKNNKQENFTYDNLNRLLTYNGGGASYDVKGNITQKSEVGTFAYNTAGKPYAISGVSGSNIANLIPAQNQTITYTSFKRPATISGNGYKATLTYNGSGERIKMVMEKNNIIQYTRYYIGGQYELDEKADGSTQQRLYLGGDATSATTVYMRSSGGWYENYICRDYLGSIVNLADGTGAANNPRSYDAWGRLRSPSSFNLFAPGADIGFYMLNRGYTGHEHLPEFGLINMNARLYDPAVGRFLSPDPFVQAPNFSQSFNRYSYALNNPLRYIDPSGEYWLIDDLIAALIGGTVNLVINIVQGNVHSFAQGASYFGVGAVGGVLTIYIGPWGGGAVMGAGNSLVSQGFGNDGKWNWDNVSAQQLLFDGIMGGLGGGLGSSLGGVLSPYVSNITSSLGGQAIQQAATQAITGSATGFALGTGFALMNGENFGDALKAGGQGALTGFAVGTVTGMASGMRAAYKAGENPWNGKSTRPTQTHHFATDKNSQYTPEMEEIASKYGLDLDGDWNKQAMPHQGRHPNEYHKWVLDNMRTISNTPGMNQQQFIKAFDLKIRQPVINNPNMLRKFYWK
jgi:RHS repeat-associated protein